MNNLIFYFFITIFSSSVWANNLFYISADGVRVRATPQASARVLGQLDINDQVKQIPPTVSSESDFVQIEIIQTANTIINSDQYFIAKEFLLERPVDYKQFRGRYFVVMNVASEILRLYERICVDQYCYNKMLLESETVVGEDKNNPKDAPGKGRTILGSYRLSGWKKFYEDTLGHYPAWYDDAYPSVPPAGTKKATRWLADKYMPVDANGKRNGKMRGAFGWYTAFLAPEPYGQWIHGTMGWGEDKDYYIQASKKLLPNILFDPRSSGCIRNNNEAIAYLRQFLETGAPIIKIYAQEKVFDPTSPMYQNKTKEWDYVLTKHKIQKAQRAEVIQALGTNSLELDAYWKAKRSGSEIILDPLDPLNEVIEVGKYTMDIHPDASEFVPGERMSRIGRKINRTGNVYGIKSREMSGVFFVDTGLLAYYAHPRTVVEVSGFMDEITPPWMQATPLSATARERHRH